MCGIVGVFSLNGAPVPEFDASAALAALRHRGPDDEGLFEDGRAMLGATRLAIIDPAHGQQPVSDEAGRYHLVMNGEIYDHEPLMAELKARGHRFRSRCDTEVAVHLVEEQWTGALETIDGQFALAAYDSAEGRLMLARDRMGISPLFYAQAGDCLVFASEMKGIFATGLMEPELDPRSLDAVLLFGTVPAPRTMFRGVRALWPGRYLEVEAGRISEHEYWDIPYGPAGDYSRKSDRQWAGELRELLMWAARRRLRADVPVGLYLSGGIDSSTIAALTGDAGDIRRHVFSITFNEPRFDERTEAKSVAAFFGIDPHVLVYDQERLAADVGRLVYHAELPMASTESVPLMALSGVASHEVKVVLTGEGADEALGGYHYMRWELMREAAGRGIFRHVLERLGRRVFARRLGKRNPLTPTPEDLAHAHEIFGCCPSVYATFWGIRRVRDMVYSDDMAARQSRESDGDFLGLPQDRMRAWDPLHRSLYISSRVFMTSHLLGARGDRALMANSVEGRYPFLDRQIQEFLAGVPPLVKTRWNCQKRLLRRAMADRLPRDVIQRTKRAFLAPFGTPFVGEGVREEIRELVTPQALERFGYFDPGKVGRIASRLAALKDSLWQERAVKFQLSPQMVETMLLGTAMNAVVTTQLLADQVDRGMFSPQAGAAAERMRVA